MTEIQSSPILEFDPASEAILNPRPFKDLADLPPRSVLCFFQEVLTDLVERQLLVPRGNLISEIRGALEDDLLSSAERIRIKEAARKAIQEIEQLLDAAGMDK